MFSWWFRSHESLMMNPWPPTYAEVCGGSWLIWQAFHENCWNCTPCIYIFEFWKKLNFGNFLKQIIFGNLQQARKCTSAVKELMMCMMPMKLKHHVPFLFDLEMLIWDKMTDGLIPEFFHTSTKMAVLWETSGAQNETYTRVLPLYMM